MNKFFDPTQKIENRMRRRSADSANRTAEDTAESAEFQAMERIDALELTTPDKQAVVELLWAYVSADDEPSASVVLHLLCQAGFDLPTSLNLDREKERSPKKRPLHFFEILRLIGDTPREHQETLAWLLRHHLHDKPGTRQRLRDFRGAYRAILHKVRPNPWDAYNLWSQLQCSRSQGWSLAECVDQFHLDRTDTDILMQLAEYIGQPFQVETEDQWFELPLDAVEDSLPHFDAEPSKRGWKASGSGPVQAPDERNPLLDLEIDPEDYTH